MRKQYTIRIEEGKGKYLIYLEDNTSGRRDWVDVKTTTNIAEIPEIISMMFQLELA